MENIFSGGSQLAMHCEPLLVRYCKNLPDLNEKALSQPLTFIEPTYISTQLVDQKDSDFPQITFCPSDENEEDQSGPIYETEVLRSHGILENQGTHWKSNVSGVDPQKMFEMATFDIWEILDLVYVRFLVVDVHGKVGNLTKGKTNAYLRKNNIGVLDFHVVEQRHQKFGKCHTLVFGKNVRKLGVYYIIPYV